MADLVKLSEYAANVEADATCALLDNGYLRVFDAGGAALAECRFGSPAFKLANAGEALANAIAPDPNVRGRGRAAAFVAFREDGSTPVLVGRAGLDDAAPLRPGTLDLVPGMEFHVDEFIYSRRNAMGA